MSSSISNLKNTTSTILINDYPHPVPVSENSRIQIKLNDGKEFFLNKSEFPMLSSVETVQFDFTKEVFEFGYYIAFGKKYSDETTLPDTLWCNPDLYEQLDEFFSTFFPSSRDKFLERVRDDYLFYRISPQNAKKMLEGFRRYSNPLELKKHLAAEDISSFPMAVRMAFTRMNRAMYFNSDEMANVFYATILKHQEEIENLKVIVDDKEKSLCRLQAKNEFYRMFEIEIISIKENVIKLMSKKNLLTRINATSLIPYRYLEYKNSSCIYMQALAERGWNGYLEYCDAINRCLIESGSRLDRMDLIENIIGSKKNFQQSKEFLLDYYNIAPSLVYKGEEEKFFLTYVDPLSERVYALEYLLENPSSYKFEQEIRQDLTYIGSIEGNLKFLPPPRLLEKNEKITIPFCPIREKLKSLVLKKLHCFKNLTEQDKQLVMNKILSFNKWDEYNLENLSIQSMQIIKGHITGVFRVKGETSSSSVHFHLSLYDLLLIVQDPEAYKWHSVSTKAWLERHFPKK